MSSFTKNKLLVLAAASMILSTSLNAGDWTVGNYDLKGSRAIPDCEEPTFTLENVKKYGIQKKWGFPGSDPNVAPGSVGHVFQPPVVRNNIIYVGDSKGFVRAIDRDGKQLWQTCAIGIDPVSLAVDDSKCNNIGIPFANGLSSPLTITENAIYAGPTYGSLIALNLNGSPKWNSLNEFPIAPPPFGQGITTGAIEIDGKVIFGLNPGGDTSASTASRGDRGMIVAVDAKTGKKIWQYNLVPEVPADQISASGPGTFTYSYSYSKKLGLVYITTSQNNRSATAGDPNPNEDAFIALRVKDGSKAWQTDTRDLVKYANGTPVIGDTWTAQILFPILEPNDVDIGDGAALFKMNGKEYVAAGSKLGIFFVLDAKTGEIVNGPKVDYNGVKKRVGLNAFAGSGYPIYPLNFPTVSLQGGYNVDSGYFKNKQGKIRHFTTLLNATDGTNALGRPLATDSSGREVCKHANYSQPDAANYKVCPGSSTTNGVIEVIKGNGSGKICEFVLPNSSLFSPIYVQEMILAEGGADGKLYVINSNNCAAVIPPVQLTVPQAIGTSFSISNGRVYAGDGFIFPAADNDEAKANRLVSLGLSNERDCKRDSHCNSKNKDKDKYKDDKNDVDGDDD